MNKNYLKGRKKEYQIRKQLLLEGWDICQRTAGSHSPVDVIAINKLTRVVKLIQCKPADFSLKEKQKIEAEMAWLNNMFRVEFEII